MVIKTGYLQSQWRRSCSSWRQFGLVGSCEGSSQWRYCLREGWWPDRKRERRTSSFLLLICFTSRETLRCWYTKATRSCIGGASRIVSLMTWIELDKGIGRIVSVAMVVASFDCFVSEIVTWNGRMARDPLDEDGRWNGVDGIVDGECSKMGWDESLKVGWRWWVSRIVQIPWQLLLPHRS